MLPPMFESILGRVFPPLCFLGVASVGAAVACGGVAGTSADGGAGDAKPTDAGGPETGGKDAGGADATPEGGPTLITEPDQGMKPIYAFLSSAKHKIDMTMYELNDPVATNILVTAAKSGVTIRVILDQNLEMKDNTAAYDALSALHASNVDVHWANPTYAATHQKTITVDGTTSAVMTLNLAAEFYSTSRDFALITSDPTDVAAIETTFAADLVNASITPPDATNLVWSPTNSQAALLALINGAKSSLLVENEELSYDTIVSAFASAASRGVDLKLVMEDSRDYAANFAMLEAAGAKVATYHEADIYIHAKVILADYGTSTASVFLGSENFSHASLTENRELGIITSDPATLASIHGTLTSDFNGATPFVPPPSDAGPPTDAMPSDAASDAGPGDASGDSSHD
jgi:cardiolipin synthase A/B